MALEEQRKQVQLSKQFIFSTVSNLLTLNVVNTAEKEKYSPSRKGNPQQASSHEDAGSSTGVVNEASAADVFPGVCCNELTGRRTHSDLLECLLTALSSPLSSALALNYI